jgi:hypothetical protein
VTCTRCQEPTRLRASGLLVHADRTRDADHLPPTRQPGERLELPERIPAEYWSSPLGERYRNGDR